MSTRLEFAAALEHDHNAQAICADKYVWGRLRPMQQVRNISLSMTYTSTRGIDALCCSQPMHITNHRQITDQKWPKWLK